MPLGFRILVCLFWPFALWGSDRIVIDGDLADWQQIPAVYVNNEPQHGPVARVFAAHDVASVFLRLDFFQEVNLQSLEQGLEICFDADGQSETGLQRNGMEGVDFVALFSPERGPLPGVHLLVPEAGEFREMSIYALGFVGAPTHASRRFELRFSRRDMHPGFSDQAFRFCVSSSPADGKPAIGTPMLSYGFSHLLSAVSGERLSPDAYRRHPETRFRVLLWNVSRDLLEKREHFLQIFDALDADIFLLDELAPETSAQMLEALFASFQGGNQTWYAYVGSPAKQERSGIVSRFPLKTDVFPAQILYPDKPLRRLMDEPLSSFSADSAAYVGQKLGKHLSVAGSYLEIEGRRLLVVSLDLQCCGSLKSEHEQLRLIETEVIYRSMVDALAQYSAQAVLLGGDFNLVGSRAPLDALCRPLPGIGQLQPLSTPRLDGISLTTWRNPKEVYPPGRLDFLLKGGAVKTLKAFAFDGNDLDEQQRRELNLEAIDFEAVSDHLPLVADFTWQEN